MIVLVNWISSTGDFIHRTFVKAHFAAVASAASVPVNAQDLISADSGNFQFWFVLIGLSLQTLVVGRLFRWLGVATTLLIPPLVSLFGYGLFGFLPILTTIRLARMIESGTEYSVTNTCRQALFLPTDRTQTYEGKTAIETFFWRFGDLLQAGVVYAGTHLSCHGRRAVRAVEHGARGILDAGRGRNRPRVSPPRAHEPHQRTAVPHTPHSACGLPARRALSARTSP